LKKLLELFVLVMVLALVSPASAIERTGKFAMGGYGGYSFGFGNTFKKWEYWRETFQNKLNFAFGGKVEYWLTPDFALVGGLDYQSGKWEYDVSEWEYEYDVSESESWHWIGILANGMYVFSPTAKTSPYVTAGGGFYIPDEGDSKPGINAGIGVEHFFQDNLALDVGARFHMIFKEGLEEENIKYVQIFGGMIFYLGTQAAKEELPLPKPPVHEEPHVSPIAEEPKYPAETEEVQLSDDVDELPQISITKLENGLCVVFGIEDYKYAPKAPFANKDAATFYEYAKSVFGIPERNIYIRTNVGATRGEFEKVFAQDGWLAKRVEKGKSDIIFYFSGHGAPDLKTKKPYLIPWDIDPNYASTAFSLDRIYESLSELGAKSVTVFLDACFSGQSKGEMLFAEARPLIPVVVEAPSVDITVFTASTGEQIASVYKEKEHGLFTYYLLKGLWGYGDLNADKEIRVEELFNYLKDNVTKEAGFMDKEQVPQLLSGDRERVLVRMK
jgi:hypothetical protein